MGCSVADSALSSRILGSSILASLSQAGRYELLGKAVSPFPLTSSPRNPLRRAPCRILGKRLTILHRARHCIFNSFRR